MSARHLPSSADSRRQTGLSRPNASLSHLLLLSGVAAHHDELGGALVLARLHALGRLAPRRHRMPAAAGTTTQRMIDRIHDLAADMTAPAHPAGAPGLADRDVHVVGIRYRADGGEAAAVHHALL